MAQVLPAPQQHDGLSHYSSSPLKRSSSSFTSLYSSSNPYPTPSSPVACTTSIPTSKLVLSAPSIKSNSQPEAPSNSPEIFSRPTLAARRSYTDLSFDPASLSLGATSISSTSSSSPSSRPFSFDDSNAEDDSDDELAFPSYDGGVQFLQSDEPLGLLSPNLEGEAAPSLASDTSSFRIDDTPPSATTGSSFSESPLWTPSVVDDTAVKPHPSRHVDYLSHDWCEEDIWSSWRHIVSRRSVYGQRSRLENASWRTWGKNKYNLPTISPESLNWLKESDVTWLYGPLQPATSHPVSCRSSSPPPINCKSAPDLGKKPILKKRTMSEVMLQRSLSASSLVQRAAASVQAQQMNDSSAVHNSMFFQTNSDFVPSSASSQVVSRDQIDYFSPRSSDTNTTETPSEEGCSRKHIRFDDKVEQCIAVECKDVECDSDDEYDSEDGSDTESEGEVVMIKSRRRRKQPRGQADSDLPTPTGKTIEKLPDTTLNCKESPDPQCEQSSGFFGRSWGPSKLFQSPSQETIRPADPNKNFLLQSSDESAIDDEEETNFSSAFHSRRDSVAVTKSRLNGAWGDDADEEHEAQGLRRTASGMFMPYEEDEDDMVAEHLGLLGKVSDTINTAKDIAHVIWNVGWRK